MVHCDTGKDEGAPQRCKPLIIRYENWIWALLVASRIAGGRVFKCEYSRINLEELDRYFVPCS